MVILNNYNHTRFEVGSQSGACIDLTIYRDTIPCNFNFYSLDFLTLEPGTDKLSRNVGTELPSNAA
jgi:hypothetical protein